MHILKLIENVGNTNLLILISNLIPNKTHLYEWLTYSVNPVSQTVEMILFHKYIIIMLNTKLFQSIYHLGPELSKLKSQAIVVKEDCSRCQ